MTVVFADKVTLIHLFVVWLTKDLNSMLVSQQKPQLNSIVIINKPIKSTEVQLSFLIFL